MTIVKSYLLKSKYEQMCIYNNENYIKLMKIQKIYIMIV